jgi:NTE family protein
MALVLFLLHAKTASRNMKKTIYSLFLVLIFVCAVEAQNRPRIALVLSGGGARGFAHIGVLQWMEEHRIPIDYIAGTSMGGLIGGMYAIDMTPQELRELTTSIDWIDLLRPVPGYDTLSFRRKEDRRAFPNSLEIGLKGGLKFPPGLNSGHSIGLLLNRLTLPYSTVNDFDDLPIPFRCLATDMVEARQIVLEDGSLATALQATMAIPGVFTPIEIDGSVLLSDGGLLNNVPTDVAEQMGADVIIAVDIGTPLGKRESLNSLGGIIGQTIGVITIENIRRNLDQELHPRLKVIVAPDLKDFTTFDFPKSQEITDLGYAGAEAKASELMAYALSEEEWQKHLEDRRSRKRTQVPVPQFVEVSAENSQAYLNKQLSDLAGKEISPSVMEERLNEIWGRGRYAGLNYDLKEREGQTGVLIRVREKGYAPPFLNLGLEINNTQTDIFDFNLRARVTLMDRFWSGSEWRFDGSLGSQILLGAEYYKLFGEKFFIAPRGVYSRTKTGVFLEKDQIAEYQVNRSLLAADIGYNFNPDSELRFGYEIGNVDASVRIGDPVLPSIDGKYDLLRTQWLHDSTDNAVVPTHGLRLSAFLEYYFDTPAALSPPSDEEFPQAGVRSAVFIPFRSKGTLFFLGEGDTTFGSEASAVEKFTLGGLFRMGALSRDEFRGNHLYYGSIGYLHKIANLPPLIGEKISAGVWYEFGATFDESDSIDTLHGITTGIIAETFLGPFFLGGSLGEGGRTNFYFAIGRFF